MNFYYDKDETLNWRGGPALGLELPEQRPKHVQTNDVLKTELLSRPSSGQGESNLQDGRRFSQSARRV